MLESFYCSGPTGKMRKIPAWYSWLGRRDAQEGVWWEQSQRLCAWSCGCSRRWWLCLLCWGSRHQLVETKAMEKMETFHSYRNFWVLLLSFWHALEEKHTFCYKHQTGWNEEAHTAARNAPGQKDSLDFGGSALSQGTLSLAGNQSLRGWLSLSVLRQVHFVLAKQRTVAPEFNESQYGMSLCQRCSFLHRKPLRWKLGSCQRFLGGVNGFLQMKMSKLFLAPFRSFCLGPGRHTLICCTELVEPSATSGKLPHHLWDLLGSTWRRCQLLTSPRLSPISFGTGKQMRWREEHPERDDEKWLSVALMQCCLPLSYAELLLAASFWT